MGCRRASTTATIRTPTSFVGSGLRARHRVLVRPHDQRDRACSSPEVPRPPGRSSPTALAVFADHPDQWDLLGAQPELVPSAVEELLRWVTPLNNFFRTVTEDSRIGDVAVAAGDRVILLYPSANRDEAVFDEPVHVRRDAQPQPASRLRPGHPLLRRSQPRPARARRCCSPSSPGVSVPPVAVAPNRSSRRTSSPGRFGRFRHATRTPRVPRSRRAVSSAQPSPDNPPSGCRLRADVHDAPPCRTRHRRWATSPALDGLRAISVLAVILYHGDVGWLPGGFLGVEVFFVVSGFLITALLLDERHQLGRISLAQLLDPTGPPTAAGAVPAAHRGVRPRRCSSTATPPAGWGATSSPPSSTSRTGGRSTCRSRTSRRPAARRCCATCGRSRSRSSSTCCSRRCSCSASASSAGGRTRWSCSWWWPSRRRRGWRILYEPFQDPSRVYYGTDTRLVGLLLGAVLAHGLVAVALPSPGARDGRARPQPGGRPRSGGDALVLHERQRVRRRSCTGAGSCCWTSSASS